MCSTKDRNTRREALTNQDRELVTDLDDRRLGKLTGK